MIRFQSKIPFRSPFFAFALLLLLSTLSILTAFSSNNTGQEAPALIVQDDSVSCALPEGETSFVIALPKTAVRDRFTFRNENSAARGELRIAFANSHLPAGSSKWTEVAGVIPFVHKRAFDLSLLGIEAKFVKLSFRVEKNQRVADAVATEESLQQIAAR